jgi:hypothetical protein
MRLAKVSPRAPRDPVFGPGTSSCCSRLVDAAHLDRRPAAARKGSPRVLRLPLRL